MWKIGSQQILFFITHLRHIPSWEGWPQRQHHLDSLDTHLFSELNLQGIPAGAGSRGSRGGRVSSLFLCFHAELLAVARSLFIALLVAPPLTLQLSLGSSNTIPFPCCQWDLASLIGPLNLVHTSESNPFGKFFSLEPWAWDFISCCGPRLTYVQILSFNKSQFH